MNSGKDEVDSGNVWEDKVMELQPEPKLDITVVPVKAQSRRR